MLETQAVRLRLGRYVVYLFSQAGTKSTHGLQCVLITKFSAIFVDITAKGSTCFFKDRNWKNALAKLHEHEKSSMHKEAALKLSAHASSTDVGAQLSAQHFADQRHHQRMLLKLISSVRFLASQGLSLHGHFEDVNSLDGNLYKFLLL